MPLNHYTGYNLWILKATFLNRGRGIHVFKDLATLKSLIHEYCKGVEKTISSSVSKPKNHERQPTLQEDIPNLYDLKEEIEEEDEEDGSGDELISPNKQPGMKSQSEGLDKKKK
jgi:hypothetical protein